MNHHCTVVESIEGLISFLTTPEICAQKARAQAVLAQLYAEHCDVPWYEQAVAAIERHLPGVVLVGATSAGGISNGRVSSTSAVLSLSFFDSTSLHASVHDCPCGDEFKLGSAIGQSLCEIPHLKGVLLLSSMPAIECIRVLDGINTHLSEVHVFGGNSARATLDTCPCILAERRWSNNKIVTVGFAGEDLSVDCQVFLGMRPLGPRMRISEARGAEVISIDSRPATDVYRRYLSLDDEDSIFLLEFPLLIERNGVTIARHPVDAYSDGHITFTADLYDGEFARLGYLDIDFVLHCVTQTLKGMHRCVPEAVFLYSCICRRYSLDRDIELETRPFEDLAPTAGFFTHGEFCRHGDRLMLLNSSQVVVSMREGTGRALPLDARVPDVADIDPYRLRHMRLTGHLLHFIDALTLAVEDKNRALEYQVQHDFLTGALNHGAMHELLQREVNRAERYGHALTVLMFDLDHFKRINDENGHNAGDRILKEVAAAITSLLRTTDSLCRYGGEEFAVLLPETPLEHGLVTAERLRAHIASLRVVSDGKRLAPATASFGVSCYPHHGTSAPALLKAADKALYRAKDLGRNRVIQADAPGVACVDS